MVLVHKLFAFLSSLLKSLSGSFSCELFSYANFMNQDSNCVCDDNFVTHKLIPRYAPRLYVLYGVCLLMCTSHVAGNTQWLVSMGKQRKSKAMWYQCKWHGNDKDVVEVTVCSDDESLAKMSSGDVDVKPYLDSRNTIGHGNHNSNSQSKTGQNCRSW